MAGLTGDLADDEYEVIRSIDHKGITESNILA